MNRPPMPRLRWMLFACMPLVPCAHATVVMNATRYVYPENASEIAVRVTNKGKVPVLMQAWIDDGDAAAKPETVKVPFNLTPPIARIEAGKGQALRVAFTGGEVPKDKESLFWLNVLEVPPKAEATSNTMQLAFRYRLKLFYRPAGLKGSPEGAAGALTWKRTGSSLSVSNASNFHVAVNDIKVTVDGKDVVMQPLSIAPGATRTVEGEGAVLPAGEATIHYQTINDYGGFVEHDAKLSP